MDLKLFSLSTRVFCLCSVIFLVACDRGDEQSADTATQLHHAVSSEPEYVGKEKCITCHKQETSAFLGSHHDLAMQHAKSDTVLGDFDNAEFVFNGITSRFYKNDGKFFVRTDGPEGNLEDFEIKYTFGVTPLQQYLIELPGGRIQALNIVWDSRTESEGGQRWYHLYPDEKIAHDDELHWTGLNHNWNHMCAECHSTNLEKNYDSVTNTFNTVWSEIDVSCEACHGPASKHIKLTKELTIAELNEQKDKGFEIKHENWSSKDWVFSENQAIASLFNERNNSPLLDNCGRCHSRRTSMYDKNSYKKSFHNAHLLALLDPGLYHADGQINDEVYVYGSFLQSKMHQAGVNCLDCHDPHSLKLRAEGNQLCQQCHDEKTYNNKSHHFHETNTKESECVSCHMPAKNYMVIDSRRDHSFRVPRPDLTIKTGSPNACNQCHTEESAEWAMDKIKGWYKKNGFDFHYGEALHAARMGSANAEALLLRLINDQEQPAIARATAMRLLAGGLNSNTFNTIYEATDSDETLIRLASADALSSMEINDRHKLLKHLLEDEEKAVRINAANILAPASKLQLSDKDKRLLLKSLDEYIDVQNKNAERAFAHVNLGNLYVSLGDYTKARAFYETAIKKEPTFIPAYANLADLYRLQDLEEISQSVLLDALKVNNDAAVIYHALGLSQVRQKKNQAALKSFKQATTLEPDNAQFILVYAIALHSDNNTEKALTLLAAYHERVPTNGQILMTLSTLNRDHGNIDESIFYAEKLQELMPDNAQLKKHIEVLKSKNNTDL
jgi:predicted CXXCH cytochrome family protein